MLYLPQRRPLASVHSPPYSLRPRCIPLLEKPYMRTNYLYIRLLPLIPTTSPSPHCLGMFQTMCNLLFHQCLMPPGLTPQLLPLRLFLGTMVAHVRVLRSRLNRRLDTPCTPLSHRHICNHGRSKAPVSHPSQRHPLRLRLSLRRGYRNVQAYRV